MMPFVLSRALSPRAAVRFLALLSLAVIAGCAASRTVEYDQVDIVRAETEVAALRDGEVRSFEYFVELKDRYLNRGHLKPLIGS